MMAAVADGRLDLPVMQTMESEFATIPGDWRILNVDSSAELLHEVQP